MSQKNQKKLIWDEWTHKYNLSKTLRFELKPIGKTEKHIQTKGLVQATWQNGQNHLSGDDAKKAKHYKIAKKLLDKMHQLFIEEALSIESIQAFEKQILKEKQTKNQKAKKGKPAATFAEALKEYYQEWEQYLGSHDEKAQKKLATSKENLYKLLAGLLDQKAKQWKQDILGYYEEKKKQGLISKKIKLKSNGLGILYGNTDDPIVVLKYFIEQNKITLEKPDQTGNNYNQEEMLDILKTFDNFHTYFSGFNENRANVYKTQTEQNSDTVIKTSIAHRLFDENMDFFFENIRRWEKFNKSLASSEIKKTLKEKKWDVQKKLKEAEKNFAQKQFGTKLNQIFMPQTFVFTFSQEGIDNYNALLGGQPAQAGIPKLQGINEIINLSRQQAQGEKRDFPVLQPLYKQILSDREHNFIDAFENDRELLEAIQKFTSDISKKRSRLLEYETNAKKEDALTCIERQIKAMAQELSKTPALQEEYFLGEKAISNLSRDVLGGWNSLEYLWFEHVDSLTDEKGKLLSQTKKDKLKKSKSLSYQMIEDLIHERVEAEGALDVLKPTWREFFQDRPFSVAEYLQEKLKQIIDGTATNKAHKEAESTEDNKKDKNSQAQAKALRMALKDDLFQKLMQERSFGNKKNEGVSAIKDVLDAALALYHFVKNLQVRPEHLPLTLDLKQRQTADASSEFQAKIHAWLEQDFTMLNLYNKTRNYMTKKPYSTDKIKLNFEKSTLADGWDLNKERANLSILFRKDKLYFLGIIDTQDTGVLNLGNEEIKKVILAKKDETFYEKMEYKLLPGANKMLPKVFFADKNIDYYKPTKKILNIRNKSTHTKSGNPQTGFTKGEFNLTDCHTMIDFFKQSLSKHPEWKHFGFQFSETKSYKDISGFYREVESQGYNINFAKIKESYIDHLVEEGKLYLFQIYNKDFSPYAKGRENLHTSYWKLLFDERNLKDVVLKLNGQAELFFRPASIKKVDPTHPKGKAIENKNKLNPKKESRFDYDIIKDRRFTQNKYLFHVPITLNFKAKDAAYLNSKIQDFLADKPEVNIIGIDRGEKHLLYYTLINQKGEILEQGSLNTISSNYQNKDNKNVEVKTPYHTILDEKEKQRDQARKSWQSIENIKELKAGYLSHVVHKLAQLIIQYNAIVVLEDLNQGFKRGRFKVEKQVYQKFERALIEKLNYLVFKDRKFGEAGHYLKAYQLTNKFTSFQKLGSQSGILFYTAASYTSKTDPVSGYMKNLYHKYKPEKTKELFKKFDSIIYNGKYFKFTYDLKRIFANTENAYPMKTQWTVASCVLRSKYDSKTKKQKIIDVNQELKKLFTNASLQLTDNQDLKELILQQDEKFIKRLFFYFDLILNMRVVDSDAEKGTDANDYILSPVEPFYNSKEFAQKYQEHTKAPLPVNGDANGAYNIARKGIIVLQKVSLRKRLKEEYQKAGIKLEWDADKLKKSVLQLPTPKVLEKIFQDWKTWIGKERATSSLFIESEKKGRSRKQQLSTEGTKFLEFVAGLRISKLDWQNYAQSKAILQKQTQKYSTQT